MRWAATHRAITHGAITVRVITHGAITHRVITVGVGRAFLGGRYAFGPRCGVGAACR